MIFQNFDQLATSPLRKQALLIAEAGFLAINTKEAVRRQFLYNEKSGQLSVMGEEFKLKDYKNVICVGFGKAAFDAVSEIQSILKDRIKCGFVIDLKDGVLGNITCRIGTHPNPTLVNVAATKELVAMLENRDKDDLIICVVSGGGSSLLCYPHDLSCKAETTVISALTVQGAAISEINTVRKHLSLVKGGNLAKICYPATMLNLIFSDVPGDGVSLVASGPTVYDTSTIKDAAKILEKYNILELCQMPSCRLIETPKDKKYFKLAHNLLFMSSQTALRAMADKAGDLGFSVRVWNPHFEGEAKVLGREIIKQNQKGECLLGAGESTVKVSGKGTGGRNQEMALGHCLKFSLTRFFCLWIQTDAIIQTRPAP